MVKQLEKDGATAADKAGVLGKALKVLEMVILSPSPPSAAQITDALALSRPTTNRLIAQLIRLGYLKRDVRRSQLMPGDALVRLSVGAVAEQVRRGPRHEVLRTLSLRTGETCNVAMIVNGQAQYLDRVEAQWPLAFRLEPGSHVPLHCSAVGKMLLSQLSESEQDKYLGALPLQAYTPNTITDPDELRRHLRQIAREGVSLDQEEFLSGVLGMAVAIPTGSRQSVLAVAIAAPRARVTVEQLRGELPHLQDAARQLAFCYD
ncbi:MAG: IclR family transcriptional regulator [Alcaligenes sp.]